MEKDVSRGAIHRSDKGTSLSCKQLFTAVKMITFFYIRCYKNKSCVYVFQASDNCVATVVVTVQEQIIEVKKKKISTNKWLDLEDWAAVYKILERIILRNCKNNITEQCRRKFEGCQWKKSTRQLEIT